MSKLDTPATVSLEESNSIKAMAHAEGMPAEDYAIRLAEVLRAPGNTGLANQRARLQTLAQAGSTGDLAAADTLAQHALILEALFTRFSHESALWLQSNDRKAGEYSERYLNAAVKAQGASARCLGALRVLRNTPSAAPTTPSPEVQDAINTIAN